MSEIVSLSPEATDFTVLDSVVSRIKKGAVCAYPTETFYGLGVSVTNAAGIKRLYDIKRRDYGNPIAVIVANADMLRGFVRKVPLLAEKMMERFWPGPLTILFETNDQISKWLTTNTGKIGIRVSSHPVAAYLVEKLGVPLTTTSANPSGHTPSRSGKEVIQYFHDKLDVIIDVGELDPSNGSTVIDVSDEKATIIREGAMSIDVLNEFIEENEGDRLT